MTATTETSPLAQFTFPRTGKRGVPQQFPRRLYEMLDGETKLLEESVNHPMVISWSESGKAFRIFDVAEFSASVLPKYFRTKKFSSFQRNLNLYGFTKVRRGPESDMYAHPSFLRDHPASLLELRKINTGVRRRPSPAVSHSLRPVSPSTSHSVGSGSSGKSPVSSPVLEKSQVVITSIPITWTYVPNKVSPKLPLRKVTSAEDDRGKLDLLAFALERASADCY